MAECLFIYLLFLEENRSGGEKLEAFFDISKLQISHVSVFTKQGGDA